MSWNKNTYNQSNIQFILDNIPGAEVLDSIKLPGYGLNDSNPGISSYLLRKVKIPNGKIFVDHFYRTPDCDSDDVIYTSEFTESTFPKNYQWESMEDEG